MFLGLEHLEVVLGAPTGNEGLPEICGTCIGAPILRIQKKGVYTGGKLQKSDRRGISNGGSWQLKDL